MVGGALWLPDHRQQAIRGDALVRHHAEEPARRQAGMFRQHLGSAAGGEPLAQFLGIDRGHRQSQVFGNCLEGNVMLPSPRAERRRKARSDVAVELRLRDHGGT